MNKKYINRVLVISIIAVVMLVFFSNFSFASSNEKSQDFVKKVNFDGASSLREKSFQNNFTNDEVKLAARKKSTSTSTIVTERTDTTTSNKVDEVINNYLKSLSVNGYDMYPEFNKNTINYYVVVPTSTSEIDVSAETDDPEATYKITGTKITKKEGAVKIVVTPNGNNTKRTYTINVTKQDDNDLKLSSLSIDGASLNPNFTPTKYYYDAEISMMDIKPLTINAVPNDASANIEILGNDDSLVEGNNLIVIILTNNDETTTYEINVNITKQFSFNQAKPNQNVLKDFKDKSKDFFSDETNVLAVLIAIAVVLVLIIILVVAKSKSKTKSKNKKK